MKSCYADETLNISKEEFEAPTELSINVDCSEVIETNTDDTTNETPDDLDF